MVKKSKIIVGLVFVFCLGIYSHALAYGLLCSEWGYGTFNKMVQTSTDPIFTAPGIDLSAYYTENVFSDHGSAYGSTWNDIETIFNTWSASFASGYSVTATGNDIDILAWFFTIDTSYANTPFSFEFYGYNGITLIDWTTLYYDGGTQGDGGHGSPLNNGANYSFVVHDLNQVPEPTTLLLLGLGLMGLIPLRKRLLQ